MAADPVTPACPRCSASTRAGAPWCTQCFLDLRTSDPVRPAPSRPGTASPAWPCGTCGARNPMQRDTCLDCGSAFLADLRAGTPAVVLPVVGDLTRLGRSQRLGLAAGVVVALLVPTAAAVYLLA